MGVSLQLVKRSMEEAGRLGGLGVNLKPSNTHMRVLLDTMRPFSLEGHEEVTNEAIVEKSNFRTVNGMDFDTQQWQQVDYFHKAAIRRIVLLRKQIIPFINDIVSIADTHYSKTAFMQPEVRPVTVPAVYTDVLFKAFVSRHQQFASNTGIKNIVTVRNWVARNESELLSLLRTGNTALDDAVLELVATHPANWLTEVYTRYFVDGSEFASHYDFINNSSLNDEAVVVYLITGALINLRQIDSTIDLSLADFNRAFTEQFASLGGLINKIIYHIEHSKKVGRLVRAYDKPEEIIYVDNDLYDQYLAQGGDVEALIGAMQLKQPELTLLGILNQREQFIQYYHEWVQNEQRKMAIQARVKIAEAVAIGFDEAFAKLESKVVSLFAPLIKTTNPEGQIDVLNLTPVQMGEIRNTILEAINKAFKDDLHSAVAYGVIAIGLGYWDTNPLYPLYQRIEASIKNNPDLNPREAIFHVLLEELTEALVKAHLVKA